MLQALIWRTFRATSGVAPSDSRRGRGTRLLPLLTALVGALALLCAGLWTADEYAEQREELRLVETNRFLDQFRSGPVAEAWGRLRTAWRSEQGRQDALLARISTLAGRARAQIVHEHQMFVLETIEEHGLQDEIEVVHQFLRRLAICVRMGSCDANVAAAQLGPALWTFRDQHRYYFEFEYSGVDLDPDVEAIAPRPTGDSGPPRW
jgi:hypothetical protein